jgi:hypothetical protein
MPRDARQRVEVTDEEDEEVRRGVMTDGNEEATAPPNKEEVAEVEDVNDGGEGEEDDEEVYEIENIIHHKKKMFVSLSSLTLVLAIRKVLTGRPKSGNIG